MPKNKSSKTARDRDRQEQRFEKQIKDRAKNREKRLRKRSHGDEGQGVDDSYSLDIRNRAPSHVCASRTFS